MESARPAQPTDTARLIELCDEALAELSTRRGGAALVRSTLAGLTVPDRLAAAMADPDDSLVVVGELDDVVLGIGAVRRHSLPPGAPGAEVSILYVEPGGRGVGLGEALMEAMTVWATDRECATIDAVALPGSREAKGFFETHGLVARALVMQRSLVPLHPGGSEAVPR